MICTSRAALRVYPGVLLRRTGGRCVFSSASRSRFRVLFMGRDEFSCEIFKALYDARGKLGTHIWDEMHITTNADTKSAHKTVVCPTAPLRLIGEQYGVPVSMLQHSKECWRSYTVRGRSSSSPDTLTDPRALLVTASFGKIIPNQILDAFPSMQKLNVHGSIVPALRGPAPVQWAIARGLTETGVSVIELSPARRGIDRGAILGAQAIPIAPDETFNSLRSTLADIGGTLLVRVLRDLLAGTLHPEPQDDAMASHAPAVTARDAVVDWASWDATHIDRMHRAISHQRQLATAIPFGANGGIKLHAVHVVSGAPALLLQRPGECTFDHSLGALRIRCAGGTEVAATRVQTLNRSATGARDWWNGVPKDVLRAGKVLQLGVPGSDSEAESGSPR
ncbi:Formyltransferase [Auricularia subglabra TFB-10046 SS5]|nr:Formyltransferase [Auricularia subglabra TFB-10046 SS5]